MILITFIVVAVECWICLVNLQDGSDGLPVTIGLAAATGLGVLAYTEVIAFGVFLFFWYCFFFTYRSCVIHPADWNFATVFGVSCCCSASGNQTLVCRGTYFFPSQTSVGLFLNLCQGGAGAETRGAGKSLAPLRMISIFYSYYSLVVVILKIIDKITPQLR